MGRVGAERLGPRLAPAGASSAGAGRRGRVERGRDRRTSQHAGLVAVVSSGAHAGGRDGAATSRRAVADLHGELRMHGRVDGVPAGELLPRRAVALVGSGQRLRQHLANGSGPEPDDPPTPDKEKHHDHVTHARPMHFPSPSSGPAPSVSQPPPTSPCAACRSSCSSAARRLRRRWLNGGTSRSSRRGGTSSTTPRGDCSKAPAGRCPIPIVIPPDAN